MSASADGPHRRLDALEIANSCLCAAEGAMRTAISYNYSGHADDGAALNLICVARAIVTEAIAETRPRKAQPQQDGGGAKS